MKRKGKKNIRNIKRGWNQIKEQGDKIKIVKEASVLN